MITDLYYGPKYEYDKEYIANLATYYDATRIFEADHEDAVDLIINKNIVAMFQGRSEAGPRALGNRSIMYDPRDPKGKDHVNTCLLYTSPSPRDKTPSRMPSSA